MEREKMSKTQSMPPTTTIQSQAFFAALLAAMSGDDKKAGDILREIGNQLLTQFSPKTEGVKTGRRKKD